MPFKKPSTLPVKRKARGRLQEPLRSWFQTDLQEARKANPQINLADFYYVHMLERTILIIQDNTFGLHPRILQKADKDLLPPAKGIIFAYLLVEALRRYAESEWAWLHKEPGEFAREFSQLAQQIEKWQGIIFEGDGRLVKVLRDTARKVKKKWTEGKAIEQAFLHARRRLIQDIRVLIEEFLPLPKRKQGAVINRLCANLLHVFNIKTSLKNQDNKTLLTTVRQDRHRNEANFIEFDEMRRSSLKGKITILEQYPDGNADQNSFPDSSPPLPPYRISPTPPEFIFSFPPLLDPSDSNLPDFHELY